MSFGMIVLLLLKYEFLLLQIVNLFFSRKHVNKIGTLNLFNKILLHKLCKCEELSHC